MSNTKSSDDEDSSQCCSVCGCGTDLFELPGRTDWYCLSCSADLATVTLLTEEIDAAVLSGRSADELTAELSEMSARVLARAQSSDFGNIYL